jgi:hypothetical protein
VNEIERERDALAANLTWSATELAEELTARQVVALGRAAQEIASLSDDDERIARIVCAERSEHQDVVLAYGAAELRLLDGYGADPGVDESTDDLLERLAIAADQACRRHSAA